MCRMRMFYFVIFIEKTYMSKMLRKSVIIMILQIILIISSSLINCESNENIKVVFHFPEFDYKENTKNELSFREFESACDQGIKCANLTGLNRNKCVRECISPSCYQDIYWFDELEDGEIDVRLNSFKGCFIQRLNRARS